MNRNFPPTSAGQEYQENRKPIIIRNLLEMSEVEERVFKAEIELCDGQVQVFVHPFYHVYNSSESIPLKDLRHARNVKAAVDSALTQKGSGPVIIMEEKDHVDRLQRELLEPKGNLQNFASVVKTGMDSSQPEALPKMEEIHLKFKDAVNKNWQVLFDKLKSLGVKKITASGSFLWADDRGGNTYGTGSGCVGDAITRFKAAGFEVLIGSTNPDSAEEIRQMPDSKFQQYLV